MIKTRGLHPQTMVVGVGIGGGAAPNDFVWGSEEHLPPTPPPNNLSKLTYNCLSLRVK